VREQSKQERGVTLIEMLVVVAIISLMVGVSMPSFSGGLDSLRLRSAAGSVSAALNMAMRTAERRQLPVEIAIEGSRNQLVMRSADGRAPRVFSIAPGIRIARVLPALFADEAQKDRYVVLYPNGAPPQLMVELRSERGASKIVRLDPFTNTARVVDDKPKE
jgi:prepilin-type N-terminal cleavage/methylation domain-containing protein